MADKHEKMQKKSRVTSMVTRFSRAVLGLNRFRRDNGTELKANKY